MNISALPYEVLSVSHVFEASFVLLELGELLDNSDFQLIYVDEFGNMSLVLPHKSSDMKGRILDDGYRCISHLWGKDPSKWDHPVKGVDWKVHVREEKREKLLQIFSHFKGYWWIDVFCTNQDSNNKPLGIMGDVYRNCKECVCMLDIKIPKLFNQPCEMWSKKFRTLVAHMMDVVECEWSKRVWTFQEWVLPPKTYYTEETINDEHFHMIDRHDLNKIRTNSAGRDIWWIVNFIIRIKPPTLVTTTFDADRSFDGVITHLMKSGRKCMDRRDYYYGIAGVLEIKLTDGLPFDKVEEEFLSHLGKYDSNKYAIGKSSPKEQVYKQWRIKRGKYGAFVCFLYNHIM